MSDGVGLGNRIGWLVTARVLGVLVGSGFGGWKADLPTPKADLPTRPQMLPRHDSISVVTEAKSTPAMSEHVLVMRRANEPTSLVS